MEDNMFKRNVFEVVFEVVGILLFCLLCMYCDSVIFEYGKVVITIGNIVTVLISLLVLHLLYRLIRKASSAEKAGLAGMIIGGSVVGVIAWAMSGIFIVGAVLGFVFGIFAFWITLFFYAIVRYLSKKGHEQ